MDDGGSEGLMREGLLLIPCNSRDSTVLMNRFHRSHAPNLFQPSFHWGGRFVRLSAEDTASKGDVVQGMGLRLGQKVTP